MMCHVESAKADFHELRREIHPLPDEMIEPREFLLQVKQT